MTPADSPYPDTRPDRPNLLRVLCSHCEEVLDVWVPRVGEGMELVALAEFGRAIFEARLVHAILECKALADG